MQSSSVYSVPVVTTLSCLSNALLLTDHCPPKLCTMLAERGCLGAGEGAESALGPQAVRRQVSSHQGEGSVQRGSVGSGPGPLEVEDAGGLLPGPEGTATLEPLHGAGGLRSHAAQTSAILGGNFSQPVFILYHLRIAETETAHPQSEAFRDLCGRHGINSLLFGLDLGEHAKKTSSEAFSDVISVSLQFCSMRAIHKPVFLRLQSCHPLSPATAHRATWDAHPRQPVL